MSENEISELARTMPVEALPALIGSLAEATAVAQSRLLRPAPAPARQPDRLLSTREASERLGISATTLYHRDFPFTVRDPQTRRLRFSANGIESWIAKQTTK